MTKRVSDEQLVKHIYYYGRHDGLAQNIALDLQDARADLARLSAELEGARKVVEAAEALMKNAQPYRYADSNQYEYEVRAEDVELLQQALTDTVEEAT
jgi:hypothetical protein